MIIEQYGIIINIGKIMEKFVPGEGFEPPTLGL